MQPSWMQVNRCIRHVFTWGTGSVSFHSGHSAPTHTYRNMALQVPIILNVFRPSISNLGVPPDSIPASCILPRPPAACIWA